jgi:predicted hotdog family 3-hydroxylacyl-ACP dehydratase
VTVAEDDLLDSSLFGERVYLNVHALPGGRVRVGLAKHETETWQDDDGTWCWACSCREGGEDTTHGAVIRAAAQHRISQS